MVSADKTSSPSQLIEPGTLSDGAKLRIICCLFDPNRGGPVTRARMVYEQMLARGHMAEIAFPIAEGNAAEYLEQAGIPFNKLAVSKPVWPNKPVGFLRWVATIPLAIFRYISFFRSKRPTVVHINGAFDIVPAIAAKLAGIPVVWHLNDTIFSARISAFLGRIVLLIANQIPVAASRVGKHYGIPSERCELLPAPVDVRRFVPRSLGHVPAAQPLIGMVGNWNWVKAQDLFVAVIQLLHKKNIPARGRLIGGLIKGQEDFFGPILAHLRDAKLEEAISAPGFCEDIPGEVSKFDIAVLSSRSEACPMSVLEAMAIGVPVVAFDVGGAQEIIGEGGDAAGIVVPPEDIEQMALAIVSLLSNQETYRRMAKNGQDRARKLFSLDACVERHIEIYQKAIG